MHPQEGTQLQGKEAHLFRQAGRMPVSDPNNIQRFRLPRGLKWHNLSQKRRLGRIC